MANTDLVTQSVTIEEGQRDAIKSISNHRLSVSEHYRRALDLYLSQPAVMEAVAHAKQNRV